MKANTKLILLITCFVVAVSLLLWGNHVMKMHEGYMEAKGIYNVIWKAARHDALPYTISGGVLFLVAYVLTYVKSK